MFLHGSYCWEQLTLPFKGLDCWHLDHDLVKVQIGDVSTVLVVEMFLHGSYCWEQLTLPFKGLLRGFLATRRDLDLEFKIMGLHELFSAAEWPIHDFDLLVAAEVLLDQFQ